MLLAEKHHSAGNRAQRAAHLLGAPLVLLAICMAYFWQLVFTNQFTWLQGGDLAFQVLPWLQFQAGEWHSGRFPLWDPFSWVGQPLVGQAQPGTMNPVNWLLFLLPLKNGWLNMRYLHGYFVLLHYIAALASYALCRELGRTRLASLMGACVFALGGFFAWNSWPQMLSGAMWTPLMFLFFLRSLRSPAPWIPASLCGLFWGLSWLSGHHQVPMFASLALALAWLFRAFPEGRISKPILSSAAVACIVMALISAPQTLPALEYGRLAKRWVGAENPVTWNQLVPYSVHHEFSLQPASVLSIFLPGFDQPVGAFIGAAAFSLALLGLMVFWNRGVYAGLFACLALGAFAYAFSAFFSLEGLFYSLLPMVEKARSPHMALVLFGLAACPLAAMGADALLEISHRESLQMLIRGLLIVAAFVGAALLIPSLTRSKIGDDRWFLSLCFLLIAAAVYRSVGNLSLSAPQARMALLTMILLELGLGSAYHLAARHEKGPDYLSPMRDHDDIAKFLLSQPGQFRILRDENEVHYNFGDFYGIEELTGYLASITTDLTEAEPASDTVRRMIGVRFFIGKKPFNTMKNEVFQSRSGLKVFADPETFPRAFAVAEVKRLPSIVEVRRSIVSEATDLKRTAFVSEPIDLPAVCPGDSSVQVVSYTPHRIALAADLPCARMVTTSEVFYPGWRASIDGRSAHIYRTDAAFRGVLVPAGHHSIVFTYWPGSVLWGVVLCACGLLLILFLNLSDRPRKWLGGADPQRPAYN